MPRSHLNNIFLGAIHFRLLGESRFVTGGGGGGGGGGGSGEHSRKDKIINSLHLIINLICIALRGLSVKMLDSA